MAIRGKTRRPSDYALPARERDFKRIFHVDLDDPRFDSVFQYAAITAPDRPVQDSIRDLLLQAVELNAKDTTIREAHRQALIDLRLRSSAALFGFLRSFAEEVGAELAGSEGQVQAGNTINANSTRKAV